MKKAVGRGATGEKKSLKTAEPKKTAGKRSSPKPAQRRSFDPDALLNSTGGMVFVASPEYRIEYMNEAALRKMGRDMTGRHCFKVFHGLEERCPWCMGELVLKGETIKQEILNRIDNRWYSSINTPLYREDGSVSIQALVFDITDQKQAEASLVQNEALLRSIHQAAPMGIGVVMSRVLEWTNEPLSRMTGYTAEELRGKSARILYADDEEFDRVGRHKYADIRSKGTGSIITVWRRKDGRLISVYLSSTPIDPGNLSAGVVFTALDVTEKKQAQDELWRSEEKYQALFENAVMGIFQSTPEGRFITVNPATAKMCGYDSPGEMVSTVTDIATQHYVDPAQRDLFIRAIEQQGFVRNFEHSTFRKDGSIFWVSVNARVIRDRRGKITHYEGTHEDIQGRKEAEEALRASEERFFKVFQSNPIPMTIATIDEGRLIDVNERVIELSGYTREEMIGRTSIEVGLWACPQERDRLIAILRETGSLRDGMAHFRTRAGDVKPALWSADAIQLGENRALLTTIHDITELVEAQEMLKQSEGKYRLLAEYVTDVIWTADLDLKITYVSPSSERIFGWSPSEWLSLRLQDVLTPGALEQAMGALQQERERFLLPNADEALVTTVELEMYRKDGTTGWFEVSARTLRHGDGKPISFIGVTRDITQRKKAEEALRKNEALLKSILEAAPIGIGVVHNRVFSWVNEEILAMTGYALDELAGKSARMLYADGDEYERVGREKYEQIATVGKGVLETRWKAKDGTVIDIFLSSSPIDPRDLGAGVVFTAMDISGLKRAEETRKELEGQLRQAQKMEAIGTLAGGIAHDFNNILFTIVGFTDLSLHDAIDGETRWNLTQVLNACDRAKNLVNQILAFSRQEAPERRPVDIVPVAKDALKFLRSTIPSTVVLKPRITGDRLTVLSDPTTIHQVLINLGTNAAHAMRTTGGVMEVCLESVEIPRDRGSNVPTELKPGPYIRMMVRDTGVGIDPAIMNRIFDPFFTTKPQGEGTGLGLSVVYGIVKSHGGSIAIESEVGSGSTFHVYLPRTPDAEREDDRNKAPSSGGSEHVLFVDDEVVLVDMGERMLSALGYRVTSVANGPEALKIFRENPDNFDLVITDMTMPGMTGAELSREILKIKPGFPIILCTGFSEIISEGEAKAMGIRRFLMKPVFLDTLAGEIRTVLDAGRREVTVCTVS